MGDPIIKKVIDLNEDPAPSPDPDDDDLPEEPDTAGEVPDVATDEVPE